MSIRTSFRTLASILVLVIVGLAVTLWLALRKDQGAAHEEGAEALRYGRNPSSPLYRTEQREPEDEPAENGTNAALEAGRQVPEDGSIAALRSALLRQLAQDSEVPNAREAEGAADEAAGETGISPETEASGNGDEEERFTGELDPEYIRESIREVTPLVAECYDLMLAARDRGELDAPDSSGRVTFSFVVGGDEEVGGVIVDPHVAEGSNADFGSEFNRCVVETLMTAELPAPERGGQLRVEYPFIFAEDDE